MQLHEMLNELLELLIPCSEKEAYTYHFEKKRNPPIRVLFPTKESQSYFIIKQLNRYICLLEKVFLFHEKIRVNFSKTTIHSFVEDRLKFQKNNSQPFTIKSNNQFFQELLLKEPSTIQVSTPLTGIFLNNITETVSMGNFKIICQNEVYLEQTLQIIYLQTDVQNIYDIEIARIKAQSYFEDFIKLILFISCEFNGQDKFKLETGIYLDYDISSPTFAGTINRLIFRNTNSDCDPIESFNAESFRKIGIQDPFFTQNNPLNIIWDLYNLQNNDQELTDINKRILNASLAIGESARTLNIQNSLIYTCVALEALFVKNREERNRATVSDSLSSLISESQERFFFIKQLTTKVYDARSDIVHGRRLSTIPNFSLVNKFVRQAIIKLLNDSEYKNFITIDDLREKLQTLNY